MVVSSAGVVAGVILETGLYSFLSLFLFLCSKAKDSPSVKERIPVIILLSSYQLSFPSSFEAPNSAMCWALLISYYYHRHYSPCSSSPSSSFSSYPPPPPSATCYSPTSLLYCTSPTCHS